MTERAPIAGLVVPLVFALIAAASTATAAPAEQIRAAGDPARGEVVHNITQDTLYATIQDAIVAAVGGDEIEVGPGTFVEQIDLLGKAITLRSTNGAQVTTIDGNGTGPVVTCSNGEGPGTVLEGFTITGGRAVNGGGMYIFGASPTVVDCIFSANEASMPAAILRGGGMLVFNGDPLITGCTFIGNIASGPSAFDAYGGGLYLDQSSASVIDCTFVDNEAAVDFTAPSVNAWGGGVYVAGGRPRVINSGFRGNSVSASTAPGLTPGARGGGIAGVGAALMVTNCTFDGNSASASPLPNGFGGGVYSSGGATTVVNCIFTTNTAPMLPPDVYGTATATYSCLQFPNEGIGNIVADPMLLDDELHLQEDSPCINAGDDDAVPSDIATDFEGDARIQQCRVDMGIDESPFMGSDCNGNGVADACDPGVIYVDDGAPPGGDGYSWETAWHDLQPALMSVDCVVEEVHVAGGTYKPGNARTDTFQLLNGVAIRGGYRGLAGGGDPDQRDSASILSGDLNENDVPADFPSGSSYGDNSYHVVTGSGTGATAILEGFTIAAGNANGSDPHDRGGGMYIDGGSPTVKKCVFSGNAAAVFGGGMSNIGADPTVTDCTFIENVADTGGGMDNAMSSPVLADVAFLGNSAYNGGGLSNYDNVSVVTNGVFSGNAADNEGGGLWNELSDGAIVTNCSFSGNSAADGGGMSTRRGSTLVTNTILWGNTAQTNPEIGEPFQATTTVMFSCVQDALANDGSVYPGVFNIDEDPQFVNAVGDDGAAGTADDDLHLLASSPCINTGRNSAAEIPEQDLDGHARILCLITDMGAYEFGIGDYDCDLEVNLGDCASWEICMTGPNNPAYAPLCESLDFEFDGDVDLTDFARFQVQFLDAP